jgi:hypothetical protein
MADGIALQYTGPVPMVVPSPSGGAPYSLATERQQLTVPASDAEVLRRTGWFAAPAD